MVLCLVVVGCNSMIFIPVGDYEKVSALEFWPEKGSDVSKLIKTLGEPYRTEDMKRGQKRYYYKVYGYTVKHDTFFGIDSFSMPGKMYYDFYYVYDKNGKFITRKR